MKKKLSFEHIWESHFKNTFTPINQKPMKYLFYAIVDHTMGLIADISTLTEEEKADVFNKLKQEIKDLRNQY